MTESMLTTIVLGDLAAANDTTCSRMSMNGQPVDGTTSASPGVSVW
jgi:hypothetical protein